MKRRSSYKGLTEDALVHGAEEGRDKLRKAAGRSKYLKIRRYPNEGTQHEQHRVIAYWIDRYARGTRGTETSKYPEEKKTTVIPRVVASESGVAQTLGRDIQGVRTTVWHLS